MKKVLSLLFVFCVMILALNAQTQVPILQENFAASTLPEGWTAIDADGDGHNWMVNPEGYLGSSCATSLSSVDDEDGISHQLSANDWLVTPALTLSGTSTLTFQLCSNWGWYMSYSVCVSTTSATDLTSFTEVSADNQFWNQSWSTITVDLSEYDGNTVYIAFRHKTDEGVALNLTNVTVTTSLAAPYISATPTTIGFGTVTANTSSNIETVTVEATNLTSAITATTTAPFEISTDGQNFATSQFMMPNGGELFVRCYPTEAGNFTGTLDLACGSTSFQVALQAHGVSCVSLSNLLVSQISGTSAYLTWTTVDATPDAEIYNIEYAAQGTTTWTHLTTPTLSYLLSDLQPQTTYNVRVFSTCSEGNSDTLSTTFTTNCLIGGNVTIGTGDMSSRIVPADAHFNYSYSEQLFLASELNGARELNSVTMEMANLSLQRSYSIYLVHTSATDLLNYSVSLDNAQLVFSNIENPNLVMGANTFVFTTPFAYNGTDNLLMITIDNSGSYTDNNLWKTHYGPNNCSKYDGRDNQPYDISSLTGTANLTNLRNNVVFGSECDNTPSCVAPNAVVSNVTDESISINWVPGYQETSWKIEYKEINATDWINLGNNITETNYTISNLSANTTYLIHIFSNCGSELSNPTTLTVTTECAAITLPLTENFENIDDQAGCPACWTKGGNHEYIDYPRISGSGHSGNQSMEFYATPTSYSYLALPKLNNEYAANNLMISFYAYSSDTENSIEVGVMTNPQDYNSFTTIQSYSVNEESAWVLAEMMTTSYTGNGRYLAFRMPAGSYNSMNIDDIRIEEIPSCLHVTDLQASNITTSEAEISWNPGNTEEAWAYLYGISGSVNPESDPYTSVSTTSISLSNLTANSLYEVYVKANCGNEDYSAAQMISFRTDCAPMTELPFNENFDSYPGITYWAEENNLPNCWSYLNTGVDGNIYPVIKNNAETAASGTNSVEFYTFTDESGYSNYGDQIAILPEIDITVLPISNLVLNLDVRAANENATFNLTVGVMSDPTDITSFTAVQTLTSTSTTYTNYDVEFSDFAGNGNYIALAAFLPSNNSNSGYIDNIKIETANTCPRPMQVTATTMDATSVSISCTTPEEISSWSIEYGPSGFSLGDGTSVPADEMPFTVTGLTPSTTYDFYVKSVCGASEESNFSSVASATTLQIPSTTPYFTDFSNAAENANWDLVNGDRTNQWYIGQPASYNKSLLYISNNNGVNASYSFNKVSTVWAYRDITFSDDAAEFNLSFKWLAMGENYHDYLSVYIGDPMNVVATDWFDPSSVTGLQLLASNLNLHNTWQHYTAPISNSFAGQTKRIYFMWQNDNSDGVNPGAVIDSIRITEATCASPNTITVSNITDVSALLAFTPAAGTSNWQYVISTTPISPEQGTIQNISTSAITLNNLTPTTTYYVYVRTNCGNGDFSVWSNAVVFTTEAHVDPQTCDAPVNLNIFNISQHSATATWNANEYAVSWSVEFKAQSEGQWQIATATQPSFSFQGLTANTTYNVRIKTICENGESDYATTEFTTLNEVGIDNVELANGLSLMPNPADKYIELTIQNNINVKEVSIYNAFGQMIQLVQLTDNHARIDLNNFASGMYFVKVTGENAIVTKKFIKK